MWKQELMWVKRNAADVIVEVAEKLPEGTTDFIPTVQTKRDPEGKCKKTNESEVKQ
ncbi:hypothetical protein [Paenibacillus albiflavus]|uniref:hypothetical protein n=1 Tax=Paenibacillus albiflavus TaxID=2545760 RepID=UPI001404BC39|nr:hypothetical protein [Paenibacillus albiflavus]